MKCCLYHEVTEEPRDYKKLQKNGVNGGELTLAKLADLWKDVQTNETITCPQCKGWKLDDNAGGN